MNKSPLSLSVFFPAYNEEANIAETVRQAEAVLQRSVAKYEIIIVNDGSYDKTPEIADELARQYAHVRVVHHLDNQGYGAAVWTGIQSARYDYVFFTDADLQFDLNELEKLLPYVPEYKAVIGYRAKRRDPFMRLLNAKGWNMLNRFLFDLKVRDIDCAFKLFERKTVVALPITSRGAMMSAELLMRLQRQGVAIKEVPVTHLPRRQGSPTGAKPSVIMRAFKELFLTYRGELGNVTQRQLIKFILVGAISTSVDFLVYVILTRGFVFFGDHIVTAKIVSFLCGSVVSFLSNRYWTFRRRTPIKLPEVARYYFMVVIALGINAASLFVLVRVFGFYDLLGAIGATAITFMWNFLVSKYWVFAHKEHRGGHVA